MNNAASHALDDEELSYDHLLSPPPPKKKRKEDKLYPSLYLLNKQQLEVLFCNLTCVQLVQLTVAIIQNLTESILTTPEASN